MKSTFVYVLKNQRIIFNLFSCLYEQQHIKVTSEQPQKQHIFEQHSFVTKSHQFVQQPKHF